MHPSELHPPWNIVVHDIPSHFRLYLHRIHYRISVPMFRVWRLPNLVLVFYIALVIREVRRKSIPRRERCIDSVHRRRLDVHFDVVSWWRCPSFTLSIEYGTLSLLGEQCPKEVSMLSTIHLLSSGRWRRPLKVKVKVLFIDLNRQLIIPTSLITAALLLAYHPLRCIYHSCDTHPNNLHPSRQCEEAWERDEEIDTPNDLHPPNDNLGDEEIDRRWQISKHIMCSFFPTAAKYNLSSSLLDTTPPNLTGLTSLKPPPAPSSQHQSIPCYSIDLNLEENWEFGKKCHYPENNKIPQEPK